MERTTINNFTTSPGYLFVFANNNPVLTISEVFAADLGYTREQVEGKLRVEDLLTGGSKIFYQTHVFPLIKLHGTYNELFLSFKTQVGEEIPVLMNARMLDAGDTKLVSCAGIRITKRNRYEQEILDAKKKAEKATHENEELLRVRNELQQNQEFLELRLRKLTRTLREQQDINAILSHDLQEPVRKISMFGRILRADLEPKELPGAAANVQKLIRSADLLRGLMHSVQQFLAINEKRFLPDSCNLYKIIDAAVKPWREDPEARITVDVDAELHLVADAGMLKEMFTELLANAFKFRDPSKETLQIDIHTDITDENIFREVENRYRYGKFVRITLRDNGVGFPQKMEKEVFRLFRKAHIMEEGHGVGLAMCLKIVDLHHGRIEVTTAPGAGTTFTLLLPMPAQEPGQDA